MLTIIVILALIYYYKYSKLVPVLMYHRIATSPGDRNSLPPEKFAEQLAYLAANGYHSITMDELYEHYANKKALPAKPVVLTFDDGYEDNLTVALPLMQKYNMVGNVFAISNWLGKENKWENFGKAPTRTMNISELQKWQAAGNYVGSHTCNHVFLSNCQQTELTNELLDSKQTLETLLQQKINCLCYPYGNFNDTVIKTAKECNYGIALAIFDNVPLWHINIMALPRIPIPSGQKMWEYKLKVSKLHMIFVILRQLEKKAKRLFR